jgi:hypothetical protein
MNEERLTYTLEVPRARIELVDGRTFDCTEPMSMTLMGAEKKYSVADFISPVQGQVPPPSHRIKVGKIVVKAVIEGTRDLDIRGGVRALYQADYIIWNRESGAILVEHMDHHVSFQGGGLQFNGPKTETLEFELHIHPRVP